VLRITELADQFPELSETFIAAEMQELRRQGHDVHVEAREHAPNPHPDAAAGLDVAYLADDSRGARIAALAWLVGRHPIRAARDLLGRSRWRRDENVRPLRELAPAARRVANHGSLHLHAHFGRGAALDALRIGALLGLPYSLATHGYDIFQLPANLREKHERAAFAVSDCDYSIDHLRELLGARTGERLHRLVLGVDGERFDRTLPYPGGGTVLAVARLVEKKGLRYLVEAAAILGRGGALERVLIVGEGPLRAELETLIADSDADGTVELLGACTPDEIRDLLERADVLAMPCVVAEDGDRDTMPVVVKEALAMAVPVVATDEVGLPEVVRPEWGRLVPPHDSEALAAAIAELLALPGEQRAEMGRAGRAFVLEHCNLESETGRLVELVAGSAPSAG
jgi:glycosyltransferase involved in cell wall biosynthesis